MPRPTCRRRVGFIPDVTYFKPQGVPMRALEEVLVGHDEVEAIRLKNLIGLSQEEAVLKWGFTADLPSPSPFCPSEAGNAVVNGRPCGLRWQCHAGRWITRSMPTTARVGLSGKTWSNFLFEGNNQQKEEKP